MAEKELYEQVDKLLTAFETLEPIQPSAEWEQSLLSKMNEATLIKPRFINRWGIVVVLLLLINVTLIVKMMKPKIENAATQYPSFQIISNALFINPLPANH